jgi:hypothetical protein
MSRFVDECRKEWGRLGVPEAASNEMAADLEADLAEAEAEGASPEDVLGAGVSDPKLFAASWARARGLIPSGERGLKGSDLRRWAFLVSGVVSFVAVATGAVILSAYPQWWPLPTAVAGRPPFFSGNAFLLSGYAFRVLALMLLVLGLVGFVFTLAIWSRTALRWALPISGAVSLVAATMGGVIVSSHPLLIPIPSVVFQTLTWTLLVLSVVGLVFTLAIWRWPAVRSQKHPDEVGLASYV